MTSALHDALRSPITDRSAWRGGDLQNSDEWIYTLPAHAI